MESSGSYSSRWLTAGGILSIVAGAFEIIGGGAMVALAVSPDAQYVLLGAPFSRVLLPSRVDPTVRSLIIVGVSMLVLGTIAVVGGVSAARRKRFGLSLAGAVCALPSAIFGLSLTAALNAYPALELVENGLLLLPGRIFCALPSAILGILAVIFVALSRREFRVGSYGGGLPAIAGLLSLVAGTFEVIGGGAMVASALSPAVKDALFVPFYSMRGDLWVVVGMPGRLVVVGVPLLVLGAIAVAGGVSAARRENHGLSLAGAVCILPLVIFGLSLAEAFPALGWLKVFMPLGDRIFFALPSAILGLLAVIFVSLGKKEFRPKA